MLKANRRTGSLQERKKHGQKKKKRRTHPANERAPPQQRSSPTAGPDQSCANHNSSMARRTSGRLSAAGSIGAGSDGGEENTAHEAWLCRSTIGAYSDEEEKEEDNDADAYRWNCIHTPTISSEQNELEMRGVRENRSDAAAIADDGDGKGSRNGDATEALRHNRHVPPFQAQKSKPRLLPIPGFSNSAALKTHLPRVTSEQSQIVRGQAVQKAGEKCKSKWDLERKLNAVDELVPSRDEIDANRRKWDLERKLQGADRFGDREVEVVDVQEQKRDLKRKLQDLCVAAPSADEVEANQRKWNLERKLQDMDNQFRLHPSGNEQLERKLKVGGRSSLAVTTDSRRSTVFLMNAPLGYLLLFASTAALHCAIFNFSSELRRFLLLDVSPFGVLLLVSWVVVSLVSVAGGLIGDLVQNRVVLLQRAAMLWGVALVAFHIAAFELSPMVSTVCLVPGFVLACIGHGILSPNVIALGVQSNLSSLPTSPMPLSPEEEEEEEEVESSSGGESSSGEESAAESEISCSSGKTDLFPEQQPRECDLESYHYFSGCFAATLAGSSIVQGYYFLLADVNASMTAASTTVDMQRGFFCMLFMSLILMTALVYFCFQSWNHHSRENHDSESFRRMRSTEQDLEHKLARLEGQATLSTDARSPWRWGNLFHLCNRVLVGYALLVFVLMVLVGVGCTLVAMLFMSRPSFSFRLMAFLLIMFGWLFTMVASSRQLNPKKKKLLRECRRLGMRSRQLYLGILAVAFISASACAAFLRAQLYTTMVVQACQTRLLIPGTTNTLFDPDLLGAIVGAASLLFLALSRVAHKRPLANETSSSGAAMMTKVAISTPATPKTPTLKSSTWPLSLRTLPHVASYPPSTRMSVAMLLCLIGVFLSSVVELYRRKSLMTPTVPPRSCGNLHSDFAFLWSTPHLVLLGASDALFRVGLQEELHMLARRCLAPAAFSSEPSSSSQRWAGVVQSIVSLAEALGFTAALALMATLSPWLFRPAPTDMALLFLLLTAVVAFMCALLKRIAARAQAQQLH